MAGYKDYVLEFKLGDGTMHSISFRIPLGENGGYYTPVINQISEKEIEISYVPSMADMPTIKPAVIKIPGSGGNVDFKTDETLTLNKGILSVNTTNDMEQDNMLPITSAGVFATIIFLSILSAALCDIDNSSITILPRKLNILIFSSICGLKFFSRTYVS